MTIVTSGRRGDATADAMQYIARPIISFLNCMITNAHEKFICRFAVCRFLLFSHALLAQDTVRYSVVQGKDIKGVQKIWRHGDNEYHYFFQFNDRGRGDSIFENVTTNAKGLISALTIDGVDYYRNPYHEVYSVQGDSLVSL